MLYVGVDWAEAEHAACLLDAAGAVVRRLTIPQRRGRAGAAARGDRRRRAGAGGGAGGDRAAGRAAGRRPAGGRVRRLRAQPEGGRPVPRADPAAGRQDRPGRRGAARPDPGHRPRPPSAVAAEQRGERRSSACSPARTSAPAATRRALHNRLRQDLLAAFPACAGRVPRPDRALGPALPRALADRDRGRRALRGGARGVPPSAEATPAQRPPPASTRRCTPTSWPPRPTWLRPGPGRSGSPPAQLLLLREQRAAWEKRLRDAAPGHGDSPP